MSASATQSDPRTIIADVARIVNVTARTDFPFSPAARCWAIQCDTLAQCIECIEEAAVNFLRGAIVRETYGCWVVYWPAVT